MARVQGTILETLEHAQARGLGSIEIVAYDSSCDAII